MLSFDPFNLGSVTIAQELWGPLATEIPPELLMTTAEVTKEALAVDALCFALVNIQGVQIDTDNNKPARNRRVLLLRHGIEDGIPRTSKEIGEIAGVAPQRISQINSKQITQLRSGVFGAMYAEEGADLSVKVNRTKYYGPDYAMGILDSLPTLADRHAEPER